MGNGVLFAKNFPVDDIFQDEEKYVANIFHAAQYLNDILNNKR